MRNGKQVIAAALIAAVIAVYGLVFGNSAPRTADDLTARAVSNVSVNTMWSQSLQAYPAAQADTAGTDYERLFDDTITHHLTLYISQDEWDGLSQDMLDYQDTDIWMRTGNYRLADLLYEDEYGVIEIMNVGIRTRGNTTRILPETENGFHRAHFALKFDETFNLQADTAEYQVLKDRQFCGLNQLNLKWNLWTDVSHIHELYCYELLGQAGVTASRVSLATLDINIDGQVVHYGVYTMIEPVDKAFLARRFGRLGDGGNLYKCLWENAPATLEDGYAQSEIGVKDWETGYRPAYDLQTNEDAATTWDLEVFIDHINNLSDEEFARYIERSFEVDKFLRLMAVNLLAGTPDDYRSMGNNYYLYFNKAGKIEMIPYDYDASLGGGWNGGTASSYEAIATEDIYTGLNLNTAYLERSVSHPLADRILAIPEYRQLYEYYVWYFVDSGLFSYASFAEKFEALAALYGDYACSDTRDRGEAMTLTTEEWYFATKIESVLRQLPEG